MKTDNNMELVSAIITTHNRQPAMLQRALTSVLTQTYRSMEVIVVDDSDASFPGRSEIRNLVLAQTSPEYPICYLPHSRCEGLPAARNTGVAAAKGEYVAFLDDDDEWLPQKTQAQVSVFHRNADTAGIMTGLVYSPGFVQNDDTGERTEFTCRYERGQVYAHLLAGNWIGYPSFVMFRRSALLEAGGFDVRIPYMEDYDLYLRIASRNLVDYDKTPAAVYHEHGKGQMTDDGKRYLAGLEYLATKYQEALDHNTYAKQRMKERLNAAREEQ